MAAPARSQRWLFGPGPDLLLGCGLGYLLLLLGLALVGVEQSAVGSLGLVALISIFTGTPHYGATLLRVYESRQERRAYAFFSVWVTLAVWLLFYLGLYSYLLGSLILTLYLSWSPWHYTGQNYGIAVMFLRRRRVAFDRTGKRALYATFMLSYLLTLLALHGSAGDSGQYAAVQPYEGGSFRLMPLGIPAPFWEWLFVGIGVLYLGALLAAGRLLLRGGSARDLLPVGLLALTQMAWFSFPAAARHWGLLGSDTLFDTRFTAYAFFWIATGHSVQYLWVTTYYAAADEGLRGRLWYLAKTLAAGSFIWGVPGLLYSASVEGSALGGVARDQDIFVLLAAVVNIHHFILDGAIWKLRDGRVARMLIHREPPGERAAPIEPEGGRRWLAPVVYALGTLATLQVLCSWGERQFRFEPALRQGDVHAAWRSLQRLDLIHADSAADHLRFGNAAAAEGNFRLAVEAYDRSLSKRPTPDVWLALARLAEHNGQGEQAISFYQRALELNPDQPEALYRLGVAWLRQGEPERALAPLERVVRMAPDNETLRASLERARRRSSEGEPDPS